MELQSNIRSRTAERSHTYKENKTYKVVKRLADVVISFALLLLLSPLLLYIYWLIYKKEGKSILHREIIAGKDQKPFVMYLFRTMSNPSRVIYALPPHPNSNPWEKENPDPFYSQHHCITLTTTGIGLQKYHLHKLPQLWNVLKGDMSLIGPSPVTLEVAASYKETEKKRMKAKPGMIGREGLK